MRDPPVGQNSVQRENTGNSSSLVMLAYSAGGVKKGESCPLRTSPSAPSSAWVLSPTFFFGGSWKCGARDKILRKQFSAHMEEPMSEYQYIAFRAIDRPVSEKNLAFMRRQS